MRTLEIFILDEKYIRASSMINQHGIAGIVINNIKQQNAFKLTIFFIIYLFAQSIKTMVWQNIKSSKRLI